MWEIIAYRIHFSLPKFIVKCSFSTVKNAAHQSQTFAKLLVIHVTNLAICLLAHFSSLLYIPYGLFMNVCMYVGKYVYIHRHAHTFYSPPQLIDLHTVYMISFIYLFLFYIYVDLHIKNTGITIGLIQGLLSTETIFFEDFDIFHTAPHCIPYLFLKFSC